MRGVLPLDDSRVVDGGVNGYRPHYSWLEATRVSVNTLTPKSSRRVLTPRPSRWQETLCR